MLQLVNRTKINGQKMVNWNIKKGTGVFLEEFAHLNLSDFRIYINIDMTLQKTKLLLDY